MLYPSDAEAMEMYRRKIDLLDKQSSSTFGGNTIAAIVVTVLCWPQLNKLVLLVWLAAIVFTLFLRWRKVRHYKAEGKLNDIETCYQYCARSVVANGLIWGALFTYLALVLESEMLVYPFMSLCAVTTGTCLLYNAYFNPFKNYAIPAFLVPSLALLASGEPLKLWIGIIVVCWFTLMYSLSNQLQRYLAGASRYETENIALIRDLEYQKEKTERLSEELRLKSEIIHRLAKSEDSVVVTAAQHRQSKANNQ